MLLARKFKMHKLNNKSFFLKLRKTMYPKHSLLTFHPICLNFIHKRNRSSLPKVVVSSNEGNRLTGRLLNRSYSTNLSKKPKITSIQVVKHSRHQGNKRKVRLDQTVHRSLTFSNEHHPKVVQVEHLKMTRLNRI